MGLREKSEASDQRMEREINFGSDLVMNVCAETKSREQNKTSVHQRFYRMRLESQRARHARHKNNVPGNW